MLIKEHERKMKEERERFEHEFRNVWSTGPMGVSMITLTMSDHQKGN